MRLLQVAVLSGLLFWTGVGAAKEAVFNVVPNGTPGYIPSGGGGFAFLSTNEITITGLGYHLDQLNGVTDQTVEVLDGQSNVLASARINLSSKQVGQFWYEPIPGLVIPSNTTTYIIGYDTGFYLTFTNKLWIGTTISNTTPTSAWFEIARELTYLGPARGNDTFGTTDMMPYGVNFMFGPPRPPLYIENTFTNSVLLLWPTQAVGFKLQGATNLVTWPSTNLSLTPTVLGTNNTVTMPTDGELKFFRLVY